MNLLEEKWLPVRRRTGQLDWIAPRQIAEPDIVAFAAHRADFNGALAQMMIGLLQTTTSIAQENDWEDLLDAPPTAEQLDRWFVSHFDAFVLDGDGARFMQDFSLANGDECEIDGLLIDSPGESTTAKNTDHFVKRDTIKAMCPHCAALALFTLQTNAPSGGAGNRTSLRGGGPLTTLVIVSPSRSLWHDLWMNVKPQADFLQQGGDVRKAAPHFVFPWLDEITKIQTLTGETQPLQVHPHHVFWAMPRRIRLVFSLPRLGQCDVCKRGDLQLVGSYQARPKGLNYKGPWRHPLSPYYESKEDWLPVHPQPGGFNYKNWPAWVLDVTQAKKKVQAASVVKYVLNEKRQKAGELRLWVFGYDMESMKPRCWYETTFPLYALANTTPASQKALKELVNNLIAASEQAAYYLRQAVKQAWFGESDLRGDLGFVDKVFLDSTEPAFYQQLKELIDFAQSVTGIDLDDAGFIIGLGESWLKVLRSKALHSFDLDLVGAAPIGQQEPRRTAEAYNTLKNSLDGKAIKTILHLPVVDKAEKVAKMPKAVAKKSVKNNPPLSSQENPQALTSQLEKK